MYINEYQYIITYSTISLFPNKNNILFPCYSSDKKSLISETDSGVSKVGDQE